jgi:hypothetical protein
MRVFAAIALALVVALPSLARADGEVAATALFDEGRRLAEQHHYAEACPKFAESQRLAPSGGTLLNLAECYEHTGQLASAWATWKQAAARANAAGKSQIEKMTLDRAAALEPKLARLTIVVSPDSDVPGLEVKRDGVVVGATEYGVGIPVDPGPHGLEATAPRKKDWSGKIDVAPEQADATISIALLDDVAPLPATAAPATTVTAAPVGTSPYPDQGEASNGGAQRVVAMAALGVAVVGVVVGSIYGLQAKSNNDHATEPANCPTSTTCDKTGFDLTNKARNEATVSTVSFVVGAAALAGGAVLWLTAPRANGIRVAPSATGSYAGALLTGSF